MLILCLFIYRYTGRSRTGIQMYLQAGKPKRRQQMDKLRIAICEDNPGEFEKLLLLIQDSGFSAETRTFESGEAFLSDYYPGFYDLVLMDIYMRGISGVEAVRMIREADQEVVIAFVTGSRDHALEGYRLDVAKYIEKPVTEKAIRDILKLAYEKRQNQPGLRILHEGQNVLIPFERILYVEQKAHALLFHMTEGRFLQSKGKISEIESLFPMPPYIRCHKSYLANLTYVTGLDRELSVYHMRDHTNVHIRRESLKKAKDAWETWLFQAARREREIYE